jgi:hypothetical protein
LDAAGPRRDSPQENDPMTSPLIIPRSPERLRLEVRTRWDGSPCEDPALHGRVELSAANDGLVMTMSLPHRPSARIPSAPAGTRVGDLWTWDVVECFVAGAKGYLEVEIGAGGHFLVLDFTAPRVRREAYEDFAPSQVYEPDGGEGRWRASITIPWEMVPEEVRAVNAFVIAGGEFLCHAPLPGPKPDFHQPDRFPAARLAR